MCCAEINAVNLGEVVESLQSAEIEPEIGQHTLFTIITSCSLLAIVHWLTTITSCIPIQHGLISCRVKHDLIT